MALTPRPSVDCAYPEHIPDISAEILAAGAPKICRKQDTELTILTFPFLVLKGCSDMTRMAFSSGSQRSLGLHIMMLLDNQL